MLSITSRTLLVIALLGLGCATAEAKHDKTPVPDAPKTCQLTMSDGGGATMEILPGHRGRYTSQGDTTEVARFSPAGGSFTTNAGSRVSLRISGGDVSGSFSNATYGTLTVRGSCA